MQSTQSQQSLEKFFLRQPLTLALFNWLQFRQFCQRPNAVEQLALHAQGHDSQSVLQQWWQQKAEPQPMGFLMLGAFLLSALFGIGAMVSMLAVAAQQAVNIWLPLALFAFLPLLFTLVSAYSSLISPARLSMAQHPFFQRLMTKRLPQLDNQQSSLVMLWFFWQLQRLALCFLLSALAAFAVFGVFQSVGFGWSSTFIKTSSGFYQMMSMVTWPWQTMVASPSMALIESTELHSGGFNWQAAQQWWPTLIMAVVVYGVIPRLMLALFLAGKLKRALRFDMQHSSDLDQLLNRANLQPSINALEEEPSLPEVKSLSLAGNEQTLIAWQRGWQNIHAVKMLGEQSWQQDEQWLEQFMPLAEPVFFTVDIQQTPTFELADCMQILQQRNLPTALLVVSDTPAQFSDGQVQRLLASWQHFARQQQLEIYLEAQLYAAL